MCSTRSRQGIRRMFVAALAVAGGLSAAGCQVNKPMPPPEALNNEPLIVDEAMQRRGWEPVGAYYMSDKVVAGPTGFTFRPKDDIQPPFAYNLWDPLVFLGNVATLPVALVLTPPWTAVTYGATITNPTYTANPPLPPSKGSPAGIAPEVTSRPGPELPATETSSFGPATTTTSPAPVITPPGL